MDDLTYQLRLLSRRDCACTATARANRLQLLRLISRQLREAGFRQMRVRSLKDRHVRVLLQQWRMEGLSARTIEKRIRCLRWWAELISKANVFPSLAAGTIRRDFCTAQAVDPTSDASTTH